MSDREREELLRQIVKERAEARGVSESEARMSRATPRYLEAARRRAEASEREVSELLDADLRALRESTYPGEVCLVPDEVEELVHGGELEKSRLEHLEECSMCAALVRAAEVAPDREEEFLEELRGLLARAATAVMR